MNIVDTFASISACFPGGDFSLEAWRAYADAIHPALREVCEEDAAGYDFQRQIAPVLADCFRQKEKAERAHQAFLKHTAGLEERFAERLSAVDVTVVLYLGLCCGAGCAGELDGQPFVLLGLEKIVELDWCSEHAMAALIDHEVGHLWHFQQRKALAFENAALWQLYTEGVAMLVEQKLCDDPHYFHQDQGGWRDWCEAHQDALFGEYHRRVAAGESIQDFFGDWCSYQGHSDVGYFLGSVLAWHLAQNGLDALVNCTEEEVHRALEHLAVHGRGK